VNVDPIALGNQAGTILYLQELTKIVAVAINREPGELAAKLHEVLQERIAGLTYGDQTDELRQAARTLVDKITDGVR
jgi:hypothetical protein